MDVLLARNEKARPNTLDYIHIIFDEFIELHGDRLLDDDQSIVGGIAMLKECSITVIGQVRGKNIEENIKHNFSMSSPSGYRKSLRLMKQAEKFKRPIICFVDTLGAYPGVEAENNGQCIAIATNLKEMAYMSVPILAIFIGNGGSGGALALSVANEIVMMQNSMLSVISPKACANILWKDSTKSEQAEKLLKVSAADIYNFGLCDEVLPEPGEGAHTDVIKMSKDIKRCIISFLHKYQNFPEYKLVQQRISKFRSVNQKKHMFFE